MVFENLNFLIDGKISPSKNEKNNHSIFRTLEHNEVFMGQISQILSLVDSSYSILHIFNFYQPWAILTINSNKISEGLKNNTQLFRLAKRPSKGYFIYWRSLVAYLLSATDKNAESTKDFERSCRQFNFYLNPQFLKFL